MKRKITKSKSIMRFAGALDKNEADEILEEIEKERRIKSRRMK